ncbi:MAG: acyl-CoA dehydratase activase [bacterium]
MKKNVWIGIDIGAISIQLVAFVKDSEKKRVLSSLKKHTLFQDRYHHYQDGLLLFSSYLRHQGNPDAKLSELLSLLFDFFPEEQLALITTTGSGGKAIAQKYNFHYVNEFRASATGVGLLYSDVRTIFEIGGERSKYILIAPDDNHHIQIIDYEINGECAAGTGSFFDQQAERLKYSVQEAAEAASESERSAAIAGRCSVFAKSDMIHAQQRGYSPPEVLKGLCEAVIRNYKGSISKGKKIIPRTAFIGGLASNNAFPDLFRKHFNFSQDDFFIPPRPAWMGAAGAALHQTNSENPIQKTLNINTAAKKSKKSFPTTTPLSLKKVQRLDSTISTIDFSKNRKIPVWLGIDIGSVSTNLALLDQDNQVIHSIYRSTEGRPVEIVKDSLLQILDKTRDQVEIQGVGTTGSGRELIGLLVGADVIKDEITAHKTGAMHVSTSFLNKKVDTIFEIGGQDSKYISIQDGIVVDFALNEACAAGTGSFLEEQAHKLGINIIDEFTRYALRSKHPLKLGERCTVFMEKELTPYLQKGVSREDITAGLAISIALNYLNRVVKKRKIGNTIFFQGGTAFNDSVAAAFATLLDKEIIIPPHNGIMGAIGAALLSRKFMKNKKKSNFRGWDLNKINWKLTEFTCHHCSNQCRIQKFSVDGETCYWGDKCSNQYRKQTKSEKKAVIADLFTENREQIFSLNTDNSSQSRATIGIPRSLSFYERLPFWKEYFSSLGFRIVLSSPSRQNLIDSGCESVVAEPCFPVQLAHGHLIDLLRQNTDYIFLPNFVTEEDPEDSINSFICLWTQTLPHIALHTPSLSGIKEKLLYPNIQFRMGFSFVQNELLKSVSALGVNKKENKKALNAAYKTQKAFQAKKLKTGQKILDTVIKNNISTVVILGRPYNLYDPGLNLNIPAKLRDIYGINIIPMDYLPLDTIDISSINSHMFWHYGKKIIQAATFTRDHSNLHIIFLSNFKCGPDSYIRHYIEDASGEPFLFLQLDSHANDAGILTRIEAFLESKHLI